jgi:hypothetical protein
VTKKNVGDERKKKRFFYKKMNATPNGSNAAAANASASNLHSFIQSPFYADDIEGGRYSRGNHYSSDAGSDYYGAGYEMSRLRYDSLSKRYSVVSQNQGMFVSGQVCSNGSAPNIDGLCLLNPDAISPPSVISNNQDASNQLDSMFTPYVEGAVPEISGVARALMNQRSPMVQTGTVSQRLAN